MSAAGATGSSLRVAASSLPRKPVVATFPENALGPAEPIPLTVLTGFLGAGKTSLLNRLVTDPALAETAVIINEFGEIGLDHLLVKPIRDGVVLLQSGCLCCTLRGDLVDALEQLLRDLDNGRADVPPRGAGDHRPRRPRARAADHDGASLSCHALPARRRDRRGRCGERGGDAR